MSQRWTVRAEPLATQRQQKRPRAGLPCSGLIVSEFSIQKAGMGISEDALTVPRHDGDWITHLALREDCLCLCYSVYWCSRNSPACVWSLIASHEAGCHH